MHTALGSHRAAAHQVADRGGGRRGTHGAVGLEGVDRGGRVERDCSV